MNFANFTIFQFYAKFAPDPYTNLTSERKNSLRCEQTNIANIFMIKTTKTTCTSSVKGSKILRQSPKMPNN